MEFEQKFQDVGVLFTRLLLVASVLLGTYLLLERASVLHTIFGLFMLGVSVFLLSHHSLVSSRGSMRVEDD